MVEGQRALESRARGQAIRVLITGASGWIGGRLIQHLLESRDVQVRAASRTARAWPEGVEGCVTDLDDPRTLFDACRAADAIVNLSAMTEAACASDPQSALRITGGGALAWATASTRAGVGRFVQVSTSKVYGRNLEGVVTEETPCEPQSHYAITHRLAERYVTLEHSHAVVLRLANAFGAPVSAAPSSWRSIPNEFCRQAVTDRRITIRSSGLSWRNIVPMADVVRAIHAAAAGFPSGLYNLGSRQALPLRDVADLVAGTCLETLGFRPPVECGMPVANEQHVPLDYRIDRIAAAGFEPRARFDQEIRETLRIAQAAEH